MNIEASGQVSPNKRETNVEPLNGARFLRSDVVMPMLGYSDRASFWQAVKTAGIPYIRINARRCVFEERSLRAWIDAHTVGKAA